MFSIKLISPRHFSYPFFTQEFTDGRQPLMNFSTDSRGVAKMIKPGYRAIVYVIEVQKFVWAIEYTGTLAEGSRAAALHGDPIRWLDSTWGRVFLPIRFLARTSLERAPDYREITRAAGVVFEPRPASMVRIDEGDFDRLYQAMSEYWELDA